jgi:hypothetical protein
MYLLSLLVEEDDDNDGEEEKTAPLGTAEEGGLIVVVADSYLSCPMSTGLQLLFIVVFIFTVVPVPPLLLAKLFVVACM